MLDSELITRFNGYHVQSQPDECWEWQGSRHKKGYGQIKLTRERRQGYAHRIAFELHKGIDPGRKQVCHSCDNPPCVNPNHLFVGTSHDNHQDMKRKNRHLYGEKNGNVRLTEQQVREILALLSVGTKQWDLATRYNVGQGTISRISRGVRWVHLRQE